jgi:hypothetical protein
MAVSMAYGPTSMSGLRALRDQPGIFGPGGVDPDSLAGPRQRLGGEPVLLRAGRSKARAAAWGARAAAELSVELVLDCDVMVEELLGLFACLTTAFGTREPSLGLGGPLCQGVQDGGLREFEESRPGPAPGGAFPARPPAPQLLRPVLHFEPPGLHSSLQGRCSLL